MMKSPLLRNIILCTIAFCGIAFGFSSQATAQWWPDSSRNTLVCDTTFAQDLPQGCTDGANGAILVWRDSRSGSTQIYAQHIDASGIETWAHNGVKLGTSNGSPLQTIPQVCSDDNGGAYVVWQDARFVSTLGTCLYAQHINANGTLAYPDSALPVGIGLGSAGLANPVICDDGLGGAYVAWEDSRSIAIASRPDIYMNRLWRGGVKFGLSTTGTTGAITLGYKYKSKTYPTIFHDLAADFQANMVGLTLNIAGLGNFLISAVDNDTTLEFKTAPKTAGSNLNYSLLGPMGLVVDTFSSKQTKPQIVKDGTGGCYIAWISSSTSPNSVYATRVDSNGVQLWDPAPNPGFLIYKDQSSTSSSKNVSLSLDDNNQLLLAWEVTSISSNFGQEIYAQRMRNSNPRDTILEWGSSSIAIPVTGGYPNDQITPQIFGDDSVVNGINGALVPFLDNKTYNSVDDYDIAVRRIQGDGGTLIPDQGFWYMDTKPHGQVDFKAVKITDLSNSGTPTGILAIWEDAWDGTDTMIYAQRMDRNGKTYFGTNPNWGLCISGNGGPAKRWTAKQPCIVPRTDGAIVAWTDLRSGTASIYCQLIREDGLLWVPRDTMPPLVTIQSSAGSFNGSQCNTRCYSMLAADTGALRDGLDSVISVSMTNMQLMSPSFVKDADSATFSVCVIDSMQNGSGTITVRDSLLNTQNITFTYCTIADSNAPTITWDSAQSPNWLNVHLHDDGPWDRGLKNFILLDTSNIILAGSAGSIKSGDSSFTLTASIKNRLLPAHFAVKAVDVANNKSVIDTFNYLTGPPAGVSQAMTDQISISVFPNPSSGGTTIWLDGAPAADVTVMDVLGRTIEQFHLEGSHEWQSASLAPGAYTVRAQIGDVVLYKRLIRE